MSKTHEKYKGYWAIHKWLLRTFGRADQCEKCGENDPDKRYEWANVSGLYKRLREDFMKMCVPCHREHDKMENIVLYRWSK